MSSSSTFRAHALGSRVAISIEDLRRAAEALATHESARRIFIPSIPRRLVGALLEEAFPAQPRALAYDEEFEDLIRFIPVALSTEGATEGDRALVDVIVAILSSYTSFDLGDRDERALLDLLRAAAIYFLRTDAAQLAALVLHTPDDATETA